MEMLQRKSFWEYVDRETDMNRLVNVVRLVTGAHVPNATPDEIALADRFINDAQEEKKKIELRRQRARERKRAQRKREAAIRSAEEATPVKNDPVREFSTCADIDDAPLTLEQAIALGVKIGMTKYEIDFWFNYNGSIGWFPKPDSIRPMNLREAKESLLLCRKITARRKAKESRMAAAKERYHHKYGHSRFNLLGTEEQK